LVASVGFIGVGVMGCEMVRNLLKARHRVRVFDVKPEASEALRADGAEVVLKDLRLTGELAFALGTPLPGNALVTSLFLEARAHREGDNGNQALFRVYDRLTNQDQTP
jgi:3-hydroxyisobutyrate dehydrogenase-like beta-hydroxyacid dehydrogenase